MPCVMSNRKIENFSAFLSNYFKFTTEVLLSSQFTQRKSKMKPITTLALAFVIIASLTSKSEGSARNEFSRPCKGFCKFDNKLIRDKLYLSCTAVSRVNPSEVQKCDCHYEYVVADIDRWDVAWDKNGHCSVGEGGPCGVDNGVEIVCDDGFNCIQGRCRVKNLIRKGTRDQSCYEDIDCLPTLVCRDAHTEPYYEEADLRCLPP